MLGNQGLHLLLTCLKILVNQGSQRLDSDLDVLVGRWLFFVGVLVTDFDGLEVRDCTAELYEVVVGQIEIDGGG